jgi:hypothetical protein
VARAVFELEVSMHMARGVRPIVSSLAVGLAAALLALPVPAWAQVAPPAGPPAPKPVDLVPTPVRPPGPPPPAPKPKPRPKAPAQVEVPEGIPYEPLAKFDENGRLIRVEGQLELLALKHNPTVGPQTIERVRPVLEGWRQNLDLMVVDNLDIIRDIDGGLFASIDLKDQNQMTFINEVFKMLIGVGSAGNSMNNAKVLTETQAKFQRRLVSDYTLARDKEVADEIKSRIPDDAEDAKNLQVIEVSRVSLANMSQDAVWAYHQLLVEAAGRAEAAIAGLDLTPDERARLEGPLVAAKKASTEDEKLAAGKALLDAMDMARQRDFMKAVLDARGPAKMPELDDAVIKPNGLPPVEDVDAPK